MANSRRTDGALSCRCPCPPQLSDAPTNCEVTLKLKTSTSNACSPFTPELSDVVVTRLSVGGANDTHAVAGLKLPELQQHHSQVVYKQLRVHQGHRELDHTVVVFVLPGADSDRG